MFQPPPPPPPLPCADSTAGGCCPAHGACCSDNSQGLCPPEVLESHCGFAHAHPHYGATWDPVSPWTDPPPSTRVCDCGEKARVSPWPPRLTMIRKCPFHRQEPCRNTQDHTQHPTFFQGAQTVAAEATAGMPRSAGRGPRVASELRAGWFTANADHKGVQASIRPNIQHVTSQAEPAGLTTTAPRPPCPHGGRSAECPQEASRFPSRATEPETSQLCRH